MAINPEVVVVDSSALVSMMSQEDSLHLRAMSIAKSMSDRRIDLIIPSEVFAETMNAIGKRFGNSAAITAGDIIFELGWYMPGSDESKLKITLERLARHKNSVSYIDCLVMAWADHYHTKTIFGFDGAFAANGYALPASSAAK